MRRAKEIVRKKYLAFRKFIGFIICCIRGHVPENRYYDGYIWSSTCERCGSTIFSEDEEHWGL